MRTCAISSTSETTHVAAAEAINTFIGHFVTITVWISISNLLRNGA